ncbi:RNA-splicing ligase RtcB, repairs tRNA damage [Ruminococcus sp. YE71]|uniref:RtcB family protein n=1 Tax=unclassified Ruminococcus TaxID=2608920 RepID=UPI00089166C2|nr:MULTISPECIES: RtcB family protein [unclassified Ruminococcus]SDA21241.1 RNA-splicing ligase RtcB, repairs tRNA damage [Ruminococcus sp. YE78]SFW32864.1 RNA-splicing ligase RtcB, repairs tRNA damage [Ruminococcus sp. YE71]
MLELQGKYATCKVFTDVIDEKAVAQIITLLNQPMAEGQSIRIMPDVHAGAGCTIGTTMTITDKVVPNLVGVDIGCGMETVKLREKHIEPMKLDKLIYEKIPSGFNIRSNTHRFFDEIDLTALYCYDHINPIRAERSLGTLGGGNHFIEADKGSDGSIYIVIHSGSRHLGVETASYYQDQAYKRLNGSSQKDIDALIAELKSTGRQKQIESELTKLKNTKRTSVPKELAYCEGDLFEQYIHDMKIVQQFAMLNRRAMMDEIIKGMGFHVEERFTTIHNYIDTENMILRKGAVSAQAGEKLLIPINMRDGSLICVGKGDPDWNCSAPHGAGRLMSRTEAKHSFTVSEFKKQMSGIYTTSVSSSTLDECPMAYKSIDDIVGNIGGTVEITEIIKPIYNFKAGEE